MNSELIVKAAERVERLAEQHAKAEREMDSRMAHIEQIVVERAKSGRGLETHSVESFGEMLTKGFHANEAVRQMQRGGRLSALLEPGRPLSIKALVSEGNIQSSGDLNTEFAYTRSGAEIGRYVAPRPRLLDFLPARRVTEPQHNYIRTQTVGDAGEQVYEGDEKASVEISCAPVTANVVTIAAHATASNQLLSDVAELSRLFDSVLRSKVLARLESQIVNGPGGQGRIAGLLALGEAFSPSYGATDVDAIGEAAMEQENLGYTPTFVALHPSDWYRIRTQKTLTEGEYLFGSPTAQGVQMLWGLPVVTTQAVPVGKALTIDATFVNVLDRASPTVMVSTQHNDNFTRNLMTVLCEIRAGLLVGESGAVFAADLPSAASSSS